MLKFTFLRIWYIRILAYFLIFFLLVVSLYFLPINLTEITNNRNISRVILYLLNFFIIAFPIFLIDKLSGFSFFKFNGVGNFNKVLKYFFHSATILFLLFGSISAILISLNLATINKNFSLSQLGLTAFLLFTVAFIEELLFRSFLINTFNFKFSWSTSIFISSILFAIIHLNNSNIGLLPIFNTFIAGVLLGLLYFKASSLWLPILYHFFWNLFQSMFLNTPISGQVWSPSLIQITSTDNLSFILGGNYGFENTFVATIFLILSIIYFEKVETLNPYLSSYMFRIFYQNEKNET